MNLTLILGASRSGTSMVAQLCHDNGAWMGDVWKGEFAGKFGYEHYENKDFRDLCRGFLGIEQDRIGCLTDYNQDLRKFWDSLPDDVPVVLKYPKAFHLLHHFRSVHQIEPKIVYVMRDPWKRADSQTKKDNASHTQSLSEWEACYNTITVHTKGLPLHIAMFERFFIDPQGETKRMLDFIGVQPNPMNTRCIDIGKRTV